MNINRENYESWFLDYLDGKMNAGQQEIFMSFLDFNPDLKKEFEGMDLVKLEAEKVHFQRKDVLLRSPIASEGENNQSDFDSLCIDSIEKQLSDKEENNLRGLVNENPEKKKTYDLFRSTLLEADKNITYTKKAILRRRFIAIPMVRITASAIVAAAVFLLALFPLLRDQAGKEALTNNQDISVSAGEIVDVIEPVIIPENTKTAAEEKSRLSNAIQPKTDRVLRQAANVDLVQGKSIISESGRIESAGPVLVRLAKIESIEAEAFRIPSSELDRIMANNRNIYRPPRLDPTFAEQPKEKRFSFWKLADAGIRRINEISEEDYSLERETDQEGQTRRFTFESPVFGISTPIGSTDHPR